GDYRRGPGDRRLCDPSGSVLRIASFPVVFDAPATGVRRSAWGVGTNHWPSSADVCFCRLCDPSGSGFGARILTGGLRRTGYLVRRSASGAGGIFRRLQPFGRNGGAVEVQVLEALRPVRVGSPDRVLSGGLRRTGYRG